MMQETAVAPIDEMVQRYQLAPFHQMSEKRLQKAKIVVATRRAVSAYALNNAILPVFTVHTSTSDTIYALTTVATPAGTRIGFTTGRGEIIILNDKGELIERNRVSQKPLWSITSAQVSGRTLLFATCADQKIYICNTEGDLLGSIDTPGRVLSLSILNIMGQTFLLGGVQGQISVYLWHLQQMIERQDAAPAATLRGGQKPAFATAIFEWKGEPWLAHGSWDNYLYLYRWPSKMNSCTATPDYVLNCGSPVYPLQALTLAGVPYLLVGTENGELLVWQLNEEAHVMNASPIAARFPARVSCLTACEMGEGYCLLLGSQDGHLSLFKSSNINAVEARTSFSLSGEGVIGIGIV